MLQKKACDLRGTGTRIKKASFTASENHARPPLPADSRKSQNSWERKTFLSLSLTSPLFFNCPGCSPSPHPSQPSKGHVRGALLALRT